MTWKRKSITWCNCRVEKFSPRRFSNAEQSHWVTWERKNNLSPPQSRDAWLFAVSALGFSRHLWLGPGDGIFASHLTPLGANPLGSWKGPLGGHSQSRVTTQIVSVSSLLEIPWLHDPCHFDLHTWQPLLRALAIVTRWGCRLLAGYQGGN